MAWQKKYQKFFQDLLNLYELFPVFTFPFSLSPFSFMTSSWWKYLCVLFLTYTVIAGFLMPVPALEILHETIRNLYFHVCMWFSMLFILSVSLFYSLKYLNKPNEDYDIIASQT